MKKYYFKIIALKSLSFLCLTIPLLAQPETKIKNPAAQDGADPWVIQFENKYLYSYSDNGAIYVNSSKNLAEAVQQNGKLVWKPDTGKAYSKEIWAPELHRLDDKWFIYFAADDGNNDNHRLYVLEGISDNPGGDYMLRGKISDPSDKWGIDGTVFKYGGKLFFIWSGWEGNVNVQQNLYIAELENPWTIRGQRVLISKPEYDWEKIGEPLINEGPEVLKNSNRLFVIYSASGSWTDSYCLGQLEMTGSDPMNPQSWRKKETPVFSGTGKVISPGHASFVKSPDGKEDWIVYHTAKHRGAGWDRNVRIQRFGWNENGEPDFGKPIDDGVEFDPPSNNKTKGLCEGCFNGNKNER